MSLPPRGMPILSGPPPLIESQGCRQCGRDFNPLWRRAKGCGHCGYEYCATCMSDGQALMPRRGRPAPTGPLAEIRDALRGTDSSATSSTGYDPEPVCLGCLVMLQVTAAPMDVLRGLPLKRLKEYLSAYDIPTIGVKEKEDLVEAVIQARNPATGCLFPEYESYYRRKSVPKRGRPPPSTGSTGSAGSGNVPRPQATRSHPQPHRPPPPHYAGNPPPRQQQRPPPRPAPSATRPTPPRPTPRSPSPPVPSILSLVALPRSYLSTLSIGTLKAILYENHVRVDFKQVLEKEELVTRVFELVGEERKRLERQRIQEEHELAEEQGRAQAEARERQQEQDQDQDQEQLSPQDQLGTSPDPSVTNKPAPSGPAPDIDRGLCVVCQDEEATLAVVDCGHLAMCAHCSDLIMATSKECPLCRTRIITPQRLIRIYRV